jgi:hypothetical protein
MKKTQMLIFSAVLFFMLYGCAQSPPMPVAPEPPQTATEVPQPLPPPSAAVAPPFISQKPDPNVWERLGKTCTGETFYKKGTPQTSGGVTSVATYKVISDDFRLEMVEEMKKTDPERSRLYQRYHHNIRVDEIDCAKSTYRVREVTDYDDRGNVLAHSRFDNEPWRRVPVLTGLDALREKFCKPSSSAKKKM